MLFYEIPVLSKILMVSNPVSETEDHLDGIQPTQSLLNGEATVCPS